MRRKGSRSLWPHRVFTAALSFIAPRTLDVESIPQLAIWGLHGLTAIDPALNVELREKDVVLNLNSKTVFTVPMPANPTPEAWGALVAQISAAADEQSTRCTAPAPAG